MLEREFMLRMFVVQESQQVDLPVLMSIPMVRIHIMILSTEIMGDL
jgi:hypothetical protein